MITINNVIREIKKIRNDNSLKLKNSILSYCESIGMPVKAYSYYVGGRRYVDGKMSEECAAAVIKRFSKSAKERYLESFKCNNWLENKK